MDNIIFQNITLDNIKEVTIDLTEKYSNYKVWILNGQMGAGKTTFVKELCKTLQCISNASSPSFGIVNEYETIHNTSIYHFDCYRFKTEEEAYDIGMEEYLESGNLCVIEWAEKIPNLLPQNYLELNFRVDSTISRTITVTTHG